MVVSILTQDVLVACIILGLTAVVGLVGNILMLRALLRYVNLRVDFFILLGSVAISDILCLIISVPKHIISLTHSPPVTDVWCKASKYLDAGAGFIAAYHLVVLAILRGILLTSRGHNPPSARQTLGCAVILWIVALLAASPFLMTVEESKGFCRESDHVDIEKDIWLLSSFSCFVPVGLIVAIYLMTYWVGKRYFEDSYSFKEKQMSRMVTAVVATFFVCQVPFRILDLHVHYREQEAMKDEFTDPDMMDSLYIARNYLLCLLMADKAARPVIYSKLSPELTEAFDEVVNCTLCSRYYTRGRRIPQPPNHSIRISSTASEAPLTDNVHDNINREEREVIAL